jgi:subtilisin family serine protease
MQGRSEWKVPVAVAVVAALTLAASTAVEGPAAGRSALTDGTIGSEQRRPPDLAASPSVGTVTLITGDRVRVRPGPVGKPVATVDPGPGREGIRFDQSVTQDGDLTVIPVDAVPLVAAGRLDIRLFRVTDLLRTGYDDQTRPELPLIVTGTDVGDQRRLAATPGVRIAHELSSIDGFAVRSSKDRAVRGWSELAASLRGHQTTKVWLDGPVRASLDESVPQVGAPVAWAAGYTGSGVKAAVLDTGIDAQHPDLADAVVKAKDFTNSRSGTRDRHGHGTHVASIITGGGEASDGRYQGVAPDTRLLNGKVLDDSGSGLESWIIAGMQWAADQGAAVANLSLGGCATSGQDPLSRAVNRITNDTGTLFVIAAGNHPVDPYCFHDEIVSTPAAATRALAVGSVTKSDELSAFSNIGPRVGDGAVKPELTAPGASIVAARATGTRIGPVVAQRYTRLSGTSMAAPHVAGAAAILAQQHSRWDADELRSALVGSAMPLPGSSVFQTGAGRLDVAAAIGHRVLADPAVVSIDRQPWPHDDDQPVTKSVTYRNTGAEPVTLDLAMDTAGPDGEPAPDGMFEISTGQITLPARSTASVEVTVDGSVESPDGHYSGWLTARDDSRVEARTPVGLDKEVESYDLTLRALNRKNRPTPTTAYLTDLTTGTVRFVPVPRTGKTLRLPKRRYDLEAAVFTRTASRDPSTEGTAALVAKPDLMLGRNMTISLDARKAKPVQVVLDDRKAEAQREQVVWTDNGRLQHFVVGGDDWDGSHFDLFATPTKRVRSHEFEFGYLGAFAEPARSGTSGRQAHGYNLWLTTHGGIPAPPRFRVRDSGLAEVDRTIHGQGVRDRQIGTLISSAFPPDAFFLFDTGYNVQTPGRRVDFYSTGEGLRWGEDLSTRRAIEYGTAWQQVSYAAGHRHREHWNSGPIGPTLLAVFAYDRLWSTLTTFGPSSAPHNLQLSQTKGTTAKLTLRKNGKLVFETTNPNGEPYRLPPEAATYEWRLAATRHVPWSTLGTRVRARWKVIGGPDDLGHLIVPSLWISGPVGLLSRASGRQPFPVRLRVEDYAGVAPEVESIKLAASFDDGRNWRSLRVRPDGKVFRAVVPKAPHGARFVSFRASVRGADGSEIDQTVIRSYALK